MKTSKFDELAFTFVVGLGAFLHEVGRILEELLERLDNK
jgi:hypothetical protein